ncbi:MAG: hypothetical protein JO127_15925 [Caulobacteraceae bacterium]|nr:hypothetical protein [Caulobacteraceae bacterium]
MARFLFVVMTKPAEGREREYNDWYSNQHLDDVISVEGFVAAQRFKLCEGDGLPGGSPYLALYEIEAESAAAAQKALGEKSASGTMFISEALDLKTVSAAYYEPITARKARRG